MSIRPRAKTLVDIARIQSKERGDAVASLCEGNETSYRLLDSRASQVANGLLGEGLAPASRVAFLDTNSDSYLEILLGCAKAKIVAVPINGRLAPTEIAYILNDSRARILFVGRELLPLIEKIRSELSETKKILVIRGGSDNPSYEAWRDAQDARDPDMRVREEDVVVQIYTSGTTGHPKGVELAHFCFLRVLAEMERHGDRWMDLNPADVVLQSVPFFHIAGTWWAVQGLISGAKNVVTGFIAPKVLTCIERYRVTKMGMVPAMAQILLAEPACAKTDFSSLAGIVYGGSPISLALQQRMMTTFTSRLFQLYGMTEAGNLMATLRPEDHELQGNARMRSAGKAVAGVEVRIAGPNDETLPTGRVGEICVRSLATMPGYWNQPGATAKTLAGGWLHTGDAGYLDADGYVYICDRVKDMIISAGENIYPAEIENVLCGHPAVAEAAVIGVPDERWGESIKAFLVLKPGASVRQDEIISHCRSAIADFKVPKSISFESTLPRNASGKVLKRELRAPYWTGRERSVN